MFLNIKFRMWSYSKTEDIEMLVVKGVTKKYGRFLANDKLSFEVNDGEIGYIKFDLIDKTIKLDNLSSADRNKKATKLVVYVNGGFDAEVKHYLHHENRLNQ